MRSFISCSMLLLLTGCVQSFFYTDAIDEEIAYYNAREASRISRAIHYKTTEMKYEKNLRLEDSFVCFNSEAAPHLRLDFTSQDALELCEARALLVDLVEGLLAELNDTTYNQIVPPKKPEDLIEIEEMEKQDPFYQFEYFPNFVNTEVILDDQMSQDLQEYQSMDLDSPSLKPRLEVINEPDKTTLKQVNPANDLQVTHEAHKTTLSRNIPAEVDSTIITAAEKTPPAGEQDLPPHVYTVQDIEIYINFETYFGVHVDPYYIGWLSLIDGVACYHAFNAKDDDRDRFSRRRENYWQSHQFVTYTRQAEKIHEDKIKAAETVEKSALKNELYTPAVRTNY